MILYHRTSILESTAKTAVNTVNCVGVMGKGLAHAYKKRYPKMYTQYKVFCDEGLFETGKLWVWKGEDQWILNFPTKKHWRSPSQIEWIDAGLENFVNSYEERGINQISFPKLGCGNGGLDWEQEVRPLMERHLGKLPIEIWIHDYEAEIGLPEHLEAFHQSIRNAAPPKSTDEFWAGLQAVSENVGRKLVDLESQQPFKIQIYDDALLLDYSEDRSFYTKAEMVDTWKILSHGLLTKRKLGINSSNEANKIISLFSILPFAKPVQIGFPSNMQSQIAAQMQLNSTTETAENTLL